MHSAFVSVILNRSQAKRQDTSTYGSLVKRLRRRPLTAKTGVRFPYELLKAEIIKISAFFVFAPSVLHILRNLGNSHIYLRNFIPRFIVGDSGNRKIEDLLELSHGICGVLTIYAVDGYGTDGRIVE